MSLKIDEFAKIISQPLNTYNFVVNIPDVDLDILVSSTSFPSEKHGTTSLWFQGEEIPYRTLPKMGGDWTFTVPESENGDVKKAFDQLKIDNWDQKTGTMLPTGIVCPNVTVTARDVQGNMVFSVILHRAFITGRDGQNLDNSQPNGTWKWTYTFHYSWIEDVNIK